MSTIASVALYSPTAEQNMSLFPAQQREHPNALLGKGGLFDFREVVIGNLVDCHRY
jgi:hypothetical protein